MRREWPAYAFLLRCLLVLMSVSRCAGLMLLCLTGCLSVGPAMAVAQVQLAQVDTVPKAKAKPAAKVKPAPKARAVTKKAQSKAAARKSAEVIATPVPSARLDLSLPPEMVKDLQPPGQAEAQVRKPLLPELFGEKPTSSGPFQLNGRLLSNEMQLQLRNDARQQDIEGAAIDFEFKQ